MEFDLVLLIVHMAMLASIITLYRSAPCWMQRIVLIGLSLASLSICTGYLIAFLVDDSLPLVRWASASFIKVGYNVEHIAVLLYVFRLVHQTRAARWQKLLQRLPVYPHS